VAAGLGNHLKLMWQLAGRAQYEGSSRKFGIAPGDLLVTSMAEDYRLEMLEGHEALVLIFDPADDPKWPKLARDALTTPIAQQAGIVTAAGGGSCTAVRPGRSHGRARSPHDDRSGTTEHAATRSRRQVSPLSSSGASGTPCLAQFGGRHLRTRATGARHGHVTTIAIPTARGFRNDAGRSDSAHPS